MVYRLWIFLYTLQMYWCMFRWHLTFFDKRNPKSIWGSLFTKTDNEALWKKQHTTQGRKTLWTVSDLMLIVYGAVCSLAKIFIVSCDLMSREVVTIVQLDILNFFTGSDLSHFTLSILAFTKTFRSISISTDTNTHTKTASWYLEKIPLPSYPI